MIDIENLEKNAIMKLVTKFHGKAKKSNKEKEVNEYNFIGTTKDLFERFKSSYIPKQPAK